jgi:hypothetical protein
MRILLADDDRAMAETLREGLEERGHQVVLAFKKYEIKFIRMGTTHRIAVDDGGAVTEYKDEIFLELVPAPAKAAIEADAKGYELIGVSRYVKGTDVTYRSSVMKNGNKQGIIVAPDGIEIHEREGGPRPAPKK